MNFWTKSFLFFFVYSLAIGFAVQWWIVPHVFPHWDSGNGLIKEHDWVTYHQLAVDMAARMKQNGWKEWSLFVNYWIEPGVAAFIYYFTVPKPWVLLPLNALIHAATGVLTIHIVYLFYPNKKVALIGSLPFVFFPSALLWVTQMHKDGFFILGSVLFLWAWLLILESEKTKFNPFLMLGLVWIGLGISFASRSYLSPAYLFLSLIFVSFHCSKKALSFLKFRTLPRREVAFCLFLFASLFWQKSYFRTETSPELVISKPVAHEKPSAQVKKVSPPKPVQERKPMVESEVKLTEEEIILIKNRGWVPSPWIPDFIDAKLYHLATVRDGFLRTTFGRSNFDTDVHFKNSFEVLAYLPRAFQVALFGPFPESWLQKGSTEHNGTFKKLAGLEMLFVYLMFPFFLLSCAMNWRRPSFLALLLFCGSFLWLYASSSPNFGTLHRFRYFYLMLITGLGFAQLTSFFYEKDSVRLPRLRLRRSYGTE